MAYSEVNNGLPELSAIGKVMGLLDYLGDGRSALRGFLGDMPLVQMMQGRAQMPSVNSLQQGLLNMPQPFQQPSPEQMNGLLGAGMNAMTPMIVGGVGKAGAVVNTNESLVDAARRNFGKTYNANEAGYMTPLGEMLDLSGRHYGPKVNPGERDWYRGQRQVDHRELGDEIYGQLFGGAGGSGTDAMRKFMNEANMLRLQPGLGFETTFVPTKDQLSSLERMWRYAKDPVMVDVAHPQTGNNLGSFEMSNPTAKKLENQIKKLLEDYAP